MPRKVEQLELFVSPRSRKPRSYSHAARATVASLRSENRLGPPDELLAVMLVNVAATADELAAGDPADLAYVRVLRLLAQLDYQARHLEPVFEDSFAELLTVAGAGQPATTAAP